MSDLTPQRSHVSTGSPHVLAFYLPQFHQVAENDAWHGPGFTEWSVVARSKPLYPGHRQPDLPGELGFYDLQVPETRYRQALLAREHGITGFLYYHYWFGGRRMLGRPFDEVRALGSPGFSLRALLGQRELVPEVAEHRRTRCSLSRCTARKTIRSTSGG